MAYIKPYVKRVPKVNYEDKKGINEKKKKHLLFYLAWYPAVRGENRFRERERESNFSLDFLAFGP